jgi:hypothetical protein
VVVKSRPRPSLAVDSGGVFTLSRQVLESQHTIEKLLGSHVKIEHSVVPEITLSRKAVPFRPQSKSSHFSPFPLGASLTSSAFRAQGLMEDDPGLQEVGRYLHSNPVRVLRLGLNKGAPAAGRRGFGPGPQPGGGAAALGTDDRAGIVPTGRRG